MRSKDAQKQLARTSLSGGAGVGKSTVTNGLYEALIRYPNSVAGENPDDVKVVKAAFNIKGNTLHAAFKIQYSPKIMHAQEVAQEVLAPQEHASGKKKLNCAFSARSSKRKGCKILSARRRKKLRVLPQTANNRKKFTLVEYM